MNGALSERGKCLLTGCVAAGIELIKLSLIHSVPPASAATFNCYSNGGGPLRRHMTGTQCGPVLVGKLENQREFLCVHRTMNSERLLRTKPSLTVVGLA